jgi:predicted GIY-YIG superfamily endonuclease
MHYFTYIATGDTDEDCCIDTTPDLKREILQIRQNSCGKRKKLLYYEHFRSPSEALKRHMELLRKSRNQIDEIIDNANPGHEDLAFLF